MFTQGLHQGRQGVIGCLIVRPDGRVFAQRRALSRRLFPGCWDLVGGHLEPGERPQQALERELAEETGWSFDSLLRLLKVVDWESRGADGQILLKREFVVAITVKGSWDEPILELNKVSEGRWFGPDDLEALQRGDNDGDNYVQSCFRDWFRDNPR